MKKASLILFYVLTSFSLAFCGCKANPNSEKETNGEEGQSFPKQIEETANKGDETLKLKIGTYNIKNGMDVGYDYSVLASDIVSTGLDICGLQEVDEKTNRNGGRDTMKLLSEASGYDYYVFSKSIPYQGGEYGTAILSKYPILSYEIIPLKSNSYEQRTYCHAVVDINGTLLDFYNTHLSYENKETRTKQFAALSDDLFTKSRWILTADFNTEDFSEFSVIEDSILVNNTENRMLSYDGKHAIDNIVLPEGTAILSSGLLDSVSHSDHSMVWAEIELK